MIPNDSFCMVLKPPASEAPEKFCNTQIEQKLGGNPV